MLVNTPPAKAGGFSTTPVFTKEGTPSIETIPNCIVRGY